jgi:hypothetical protein
MIENLLIVECLPKCPKQRVSSCHWSAPSSLRPMTRPDDMVAEAGRRISQLAARGTAAPARGGGRERGKRTHVACSAASLHAPPPK